MTCLKSYRGGHAALTMREGTCMGIKKEASDWEISHVSTSLEVIKRKEMTCGSRERSTGEREIDR